MIVWGDFTNIWGNKRSEKERRKEKYTQMNVESKRIARRDKKTFFFLN